MIISCQRYLQFLGDGLQEEILESHRLQRSPFVVQATCNSCTQPFVRFVKFPAKTLREVSGEERFESRDITIICTYMCNYSSILIIDMDRGELSDPRIYTEACFGFLGNRKRTRGWASDISYSSVGLWIRHVVFGFRKSV